jgi:hypothetical protein
MYDAKFPVKSQAQLENSLIAPFTNQPREEPHLMRATSY